MPASKTEIESLIHLLEDPDPEVQSSVRNRFHELGENAVPLLDQYRIRTTDRREKSAINDIIHTITFGTLYEDFCQLLDRGLDDRHKLERAVFMLARFGSPTLRTEEYQRKLDRLAGGIRERIAGETSGSRKMHILLRYVFRELKFRGDDKQYHNPENSYIDRVIDRRKGLPISLSLILMFLAARLGLPFHGVNMPIHFMLLYRNGKKDLLVDPFDGGTIVTYDQCHWFLKKNGVTPRPEHFRRAGEQEIFMRCVRNLMNSYSKMKRGDKVRDLQALLQLIELKG